MDQGSWLAQACIFLAAAVVSVPLAKRLGLGSVLGYLIAGALIGPHVLGLLGEPEGVMHVAEFGVVIMLFLIGLEIRPSYLWQMRAAILGLGGGQVVVTTLAVAAVALACGLPWQHALAVGMIAAMSSTAIVLQSLRERGLDSSQPGRAAFSVLLFQDIAVIPMLALLPLLATQAVVADAAAPHGHSLIGGLPDWAQALVVLGAVAGIVVAGRYALRPVFRYIASTGLREIFTATALLLVVAVALLMQAVGLSAALGAFVAGVVLADSEFRHELETDIEPFRGLLLGLFFISVGASIDFALLAAQPLLILALVVALIAIKTTVLYVLARLFRDGHADALLLALCLAQGGEFAFVLFAFAESVNVLDAGITGPLVLAVALSMAATPLLFMLAQRLRGKPARKPRPDEKIDNQHPQVIIAGFGRFGQIVGRLLRANGYRSSVLDHSADQIDLVRRAGNQANYGDASRMDLLRAAGAETAQALVIAIDDEARTSEIVESARKHFPQLRILARAYDRRHLYELRKLGADVIERETFAGAVNLGARTLRLLGMRAHQAHRAAQLFSYYDNDLIDRLEPYWGNLEIYRTQLGKQTADVEALMREDAEAFHLGQAQHGWDAAPEAEASSTTGGQMAR
ncbi:monovalent cation:proton antiporter-2 (CPA2) family protein [Uliginosibacterium sp. H1]|uniref:monovalent cation:proton antiporter-2 (CPA2) family protein n=1 Tax=Uliginosibacterium sp. H1 TaxID=3114757 RepID=UPI002E17C0AD|nr:monovalent cation:proton antiporter-2 (CPA2) family protein [Uliginosibacterium sp. H1]